MRAGLRADIQTTDVAQTVRELLVSLFQTALILIGNLGEQTLEVLLETVGSVSCILIDPAAAHQLEYQNH